jgi:hypothetical protein
MGNHILSFIIIVIRNRYIYISLIIAEYPSYKKKKKKNWRISLAFEISGAEHGSGCG